MRHWVPLVVCAGFAAGCIVPVTEPLGGVNTADPDKNLVGEWRRDKSSGRARDVRLWTLTVDAPAVKGNPKGLVRCRRDEEKEGRWFYTHAVGKHTYAVVCALGGSEDEVDFGKEGEFARWMKFEKKVFLIYRYALDGGKLTVDIGDADAVKKQFGAAGIKAGKGGAFLTPAGWLAGHLEKNADAIYDGKNVLEFTRVDR